MTERTAFVQVAPSPLPASAANLERVRTPAARARLLLLAVLAAGLLLRLWLAYVVFPGQGFASDMRLFAGWARSLAANGPGVFYASDPTANYPPAYMYVLWLLGRLASGDALLLLLKLPAILADIVKRIVEAANPEKIVLFGSAARGEMGRERAERIGAETLRARLARSLLNGCSFS